MSARPYRYLVAVALCAFTCTRSFAQVEAAVPRECSLDGLPRKGDGGRNEPLIEGRTGWLAGFPTYDNRERINWKKKPWTVPTLVQTGPNAWDPTGPVLQHKTPVRVLKQHLEHSGYGNYKGYLEVATQDGTRATVGIGYFTYRPFWACPLRYISSATSLWQDVGRHIIAGMKAGAKPVDRDGKWVELKKNEQLVCDASVHNSHTPGEGPVIECSVIDSKGRDMSATVRARVGDVSILY